MTVEEAKNLKVGDRVRWASSGERGTVTRASIDTVAVCWDDEADEEEEYLYDPNEFRFGLLHVEKIETAEVSK